MIFRNALNAKIAILENNDICAFCGDKLFYHDIDELNRDIIPLTKTFISKCFSQTRILSQEDTFCGRCHGSFKEHVENNFKCVGVKV